MSLSGSIKLAEDKMKKTVAVMDSEFKSIRTGRASVSLVDELKIDYYGNATPLKQLATISTPQASLIMIQPWDANVIADIEKGILKSNLGFTPSNDGKVIRIAVPQLTTEKREEMVKLAKKTAEDAKISIRGIRREANETLEKEKEQSAISEDELFKGRDKIQKLTDEYSDRIDEFLKAKEKEVLEF
ncbi:MAG: ribosome recycling factor [Candidatus Omnitrophota bacterium]